MSRSMACQAFDPACLQPAHLPAWLPYLLGPSSPGEYSGFLLMSSSYVKLQLVYFAWNSGSYLCWAQSFEMLCSGSHDISFGPQCYCSSCVIMELPLVLILLHPILNDFYIELIAFTVGWLFTWLFLCTLKLLLKLNAINQF